MDPWSSRRWPRLGGSLLLLLALAACSIEQPEMPIVESEWILPVGSVVYTVRELVEDEEGLIVADDGILSFFAEGELDSFAVGDRLDIELEGQSVGASIGEISLEPGGAASFGFRLGTIYPAAETLDGLTLPVPGFNFDLGAPAEDLPGFTSATVSSGNLDIDLDNGLPVEVGGSAAPEQIQISLIDPADASVLAAETVMGSIAAGTSRTVSIDLSGLVLPDSIEVEITGGSAGSGGAPVLVDADASLAVDVSTSTLTVDAAQAPIGAQTFADTTAIDLPDSMRILRATISAGVLRLDSQNDLSVDLTANLRIAAFLDVGGAPLSIDIPMGAGAVATNTVDLAGYRLDFEGDFGEQLEIVTTVDTPGSGGASVWIAASDEISVSVDPLMLRFDSITGSMDPKQVVIDPSSVDIQIPEELDELTLAEAELSVILDSSLELPGLIDLHLEGRNEAGNVVPLDVEVPIPPDLPGKINTTVVLDQSNSDIVNFLNNLPISIEASGTARIGDGISVGTVRGDDAVSARYEIVAPLRVAVAAQDVDLNQACVDLDEDLKDNLRDRLVAMSFNTTVTSTLPLEVDAYIYLDPLEGRVETNPRIVLGPVHLPAAPEPKAGQPRRSVTAENLVELTNDQIPLLLQDDLFQFVRLSVAGTDGRFITLRANDQVEFTGFLKARVRLGDE